MHDGVLDAQKCRCVNGAVHFFVKECHVLLVFCSAPADKRKMADLKADTDLLGVCENLLYLRTPAVRGKIQQGGAEIGSVKACFLVKAESRPDVFGEILSRMTVKIERRAYA